ncbi:hypothetical protein Hokovirus_1_263 [Hokovirus HKV1]|uniref:Uncharacterized protein n=1 Tax=Hokovirus HKV1 TaxID=1977638 RepID=A0A1V0SFG1_9VIRU|nr:hypothetical protein Hokovirus_1_263 [Hokovirus HKV1]
MELKLVNLEYRVIMNASHYYGLDNGVVYKDCNEIPDNYDIIILNDNVERVIHNDNYRFIIRDNIRAIYYNIKFKLYDNCGLIIQKTKSENDILLKLINRIRLLSGFGRFYLEYTFPNNDTTEELNDYLPIIIFTDIDIKNNDILRSSFNITQINNICYLLEKREIMIKGAIKKN